MAFPFSARQDFNGSSYKIIVDGFRVFLMSPFLQWVVHWFIMQNNRSIIDIVKCVRSWSLICGQPSRYT
jgi:hypothetical protein